MKFFDESGEIKKSRHKLPHWQQDGVPIFITWRLNDSLPKEVVTRWKRDRESWRRKQSEPWDDETKQEYQRRFVMKLEEVLDDCHGSCILERAEVRKIVVDAIHYFDGERIDLDCYVAMPNHIHTLFSVRPGFQLEKVMKSIKGVSAREINKVTGSRGTLWQADFWDRLVRSEKHLFWTRRYIERNPAKLSKGRYTHWDKERGHF